MPEPKKFSANLTRDALRNFGASFLVDAVEVTRKHDGLVMKAVEYFVGEKVFCDSFDTAIKLQRSLNCRSIVTSEGTELK